MKLRAGISIVFSLIALTACGGGSPAPVQQATETPIDTADATTTNLPPQIAGTAPAAKENQLFEYSPLISDAEGDDVTLSISNLPSWLSFDAATATLSGTPSANDIGSHAGIELTASDGLSQTRVVITIDVAYDELEQALRTGDASVVGDEHTLLDGAVDAVEANRTRYASTVNRLFALNLDGTPKTDSLTNISWDPTHDAALLKSRFGSNHAILTSNAVTNRSYVVQQRALGVIGETDAARYAVFGSNPMRNHYRSPGSLSDDMRSLMDNTLDWLTARNPDSGQPLSVVIAQFDQSFYFPDQVAVRDWLDRRYGDLVSYNAATECNGDQLQGCLDSTPDLLLISQHLYDGEQSSVIAAQVERAMLEGTAVLYLHHNGNYGKLAIQLFALFNVDYHGDNYWRKLAIENYDVTAEPNELPADVGAVLELIDRLKNQSFSFDLSRCEDTSCPTDHAYNREFLAPVESLQGLLWSLDQQGVRLFESDAFRYQKLLILLGDFYRQRVRFPMDRDITPTIRFLRSLYADHTIYHNRQLNRVQPDMGNFSRSDFSHVTPATRLVTLTSKSAFRASGAYALPGTSFSVTRLDSNSVDTRIFINTLRSSATHQFDQNGYSRPKHLESTRFALAPGQTLTLSSPHGGPIQVEFSDNDIPVELRFEHVGEHPFWASAADDADFAQALERGDYDWAELVTPGFEVHSTLEKMRQTVANPLWGTPSQVAAATRRYTHNYPHILAGLRGPGIDPVPEIYDFAAANGLAIHTIDQVKHMNADQASCGYGCSGNPYDAYWSFDPLGYGDLHELGHGLERSRFRFDGWEAHASTDYYAYYSRFRYYKNTGDLNVLDGCQDLPFSRLFDTVQESVTTQDPLAFMRAADLNGWSEGSAIFLQLMMRVQGDNALDSGWNLLARLHVIEREFSRADDTDADWADLNAGLGFGGMSRLDARRLSNDDWLLIALSHASGRDLRDYLAMWGFSFTDAALGHVESMHLPDLPVEFHVLDPNAYCLGLDHPSVPVDGRQVWPAGT